MFVTEILEDYKEGLEMLGWLSSCSDHSGDGRPTPEPKDCREECMEICFPEEEFNRAHCGPIGFTGLLMTLAFMLIAKVI